MTTFREQEINTDKYIGASFKEIKLILNKAKNIDVRNDWVDHLKYNSEKLSNLRKIRPPPLPHATQ